MLSELCRMCLAGGDTVSVTLQERFSALFGVPVREIYGFTRNALLFIKPARNIHESFRLN